MKIIKHFEKFSVEHDDPFWYYNEQIASVDFDDGDVLYLESRGAIEVIFKPDDVKYKGFNAIAEAHDRNYTDKDLVKFHDHDGWIMNNWFVVCEEDGDDIIVCHSYDEGLIALVQQATFKAINKAIVTLEGIGDDFSNMTEDCVQPSIDLLYQTLKLNENEESNN